ncbi:hypothetical protein [Gemmata sp. SH-PL17]|uniref:hypothetical protein n=1 Tax=Gemmata sp. SH-PL17 TaxID=1630693 RepID=UPI001EF5F441|nr:hypothetical protein [Gemmata sp. SH-PL17]
MKLKAVRVGGRWATTEKWVQEFIAAMTEAHLPATPTAPRTPAERERDVAAANATLALLGV